MGLQGLICLVRGHRFSPVGGSHAGEALIRCGRCGHEIVYSAETFELETWPERWTRLELADEVYWNPDLTARSETTLVAAVQARSRSLTGPS